MNRKTLYLASVAAACAVALPQAASAALTVNMAGQALGFSITTFSTLPQSPGTPYGAWGSAVLANGNVVVNGYLPGSGTTVNRVFTDVDGHTFGDALSTKTWNDGNYASSLTRLGSTVYGTHFSDNTVRVVNADGSEGAIVSNVGRGGIDADAARNSLLVATDLGLEEIDLNNANPATNFRYVAGPGGGAIDGVTVSSDGQTAYVEQNGAIVGYRISDGAQVYFSSQVGAPDGVGVIRSGTLAGDLIVNTNFGQLALLDVVAHTSTIIADSGSRGDYVGFDPNGTLFLSQSDSLLRLSLSGGTIGGGGGAVPEPATWVMMLAGFGGLGAMMRSRRRAMAATA